MRALGAAVLLALAAATGARAGGFFDDVPKKGYVRDDVSMDVLDAGGGAVVARIRYLRVFLDPGRRSIAPEAWPQREMLLVEMGSGERVVLERLTNLTDDGDPAAPRPRGRIGLDGSALEIWTRVASAAGDACGALDLLVHAGNLEVPVASGDLAARTVRLGIAQAVETALAPRERELVTSAIPILVASKTQGLPAAPLDVLEVLFPGQPFTRAAAGLSFRVSATAPLNPGDGGWRSLTEPPDMLPGAPLY